MPRTVLGLVGGIASGKSTVAGLFAAERPCALLDADAIAARVLKEPEVQRELAPIFPDAFGPGGEVHKDRIARRAFQDTHALKALESATHPRIRRDIEEAIRRAKEPFVLLDAALLLETGARGFCDFVLYVACPARVRRERSSKTRGWTEGEHRLRESRQWPVRKKREASDFVIENGNGIEETRRGVRRVLEAIDKKGTSDRKNHACR